MSNTTKKMDSHKETARILIVDDEPKFISLLRQVLTAAGYEVFVANKGERAIHMAALEQPDMIITDINLPGDTDGFEVVQNVREFTEIPIIILSQSKETDDILRGFEVGADDFVTKPFNSKIFLARLQAIFKRCRTFPETPAEIVCENLVINLPRRQVTLDGEEIYLSQTEYNLLLEMARHRDKVLLHEQLLSAVWGDQYRTEVDYLRSYIHILRRKVEPNPSHPKRIISKPGVGYMLLSSTTREAGD